MTTLHGEYKVPGGKLVVVDPEVDQDRLHRVILSSDFFLEPDDALGAMAAAVTGLPTGTDVETFTAAIRGALGRGVTMVG